MRIPRKKACKTLSENLKNHKGLEVSIGYGVHAGTSLKCLLVYVHRGKKYMKLIPQEWEGWPVKTQWVGRVKPSVGTLTDLGDFSEK